jgi:hypothetical protein
MGSIDDVGASSADEYVTSVRRRLDIMYNLQQVIEAKSRKEMIERYARTKARPYEFDKGHLVYLNNPVPRDGQPRKLAPLWVGPFEILEKVSPHSVKLRDVMTLKELPNDVHVDRLKRCVVARDYFVNSPSARKDFSVPLSITRQVGQKFLVKFGVSDGNVDDVTEKWVGVHACPPLLLKDWRKTHCKDGKPRARKTEVTSPNVSDTVPLDAPPMQQFAEDIVLPEAPDGTYLLRNDGNRVPIKTVSDLPTENLRRSSRRTNRVDMI